MMKRFFITFMVLLLVPLVCSADPWNFNLSAGSTSVAGGLHYKTYLDSGYLRVGGSGVYTDNDNTAYRWGSFDFTVGSDTLSPGLNVDVGLRAIGGSAGDGVHSGGIGAAAFTVSGDYSLSSDVVPVPIEFFSGLTWAPKPLSFSDTKGYLEFNLGLGVQVIQNASVMLSYSVYRVAMESGPGDWDMNDDVLRAGIVLRF